MPNPANWAVLLEQSITGGSHYVLILPSVQICTEYRRTVFNHQGGRSHKQAIDSLSRLAAFHGFNSIWHVNGNGV